MEPPETKIQSWVQTSPNSQSISRCEITRELTPAISTMMLSVISLFALSLAALCRSVIAFRRSPSDTWTSASIPCTHKTKHHGHVSMQMRLSYKNSKHFRFSCWPLCCIWDSPSHRFPPDAPAESRWRGVWSGIWSSGTSKARWFCKMQRPRSEHSEIPGGNKSVCVLIYYMFPKGGTLWNVHRRTVQLKSIVRTNPTV